MTDKEIFISKMVHFLNRRGIRRMVQENTPSGVQLERTKERYKFYECDQNAQV